MSDTVVGQTPLLAREPQSQQPVPPAPAFIHQSDIVVEARLQAIETYVARAEQNQAFWSALLTTTVNDLALCKRVLSELKNKVGSLVQEVEDLKKRVDQAFEARVVRLTAPHISATQHRVAQIETHLTKAHLQLNERLKYTVEQQARQSDSFQHRYVGPLFRMLEQILAGSVDPARINQVANQNLKPAVTPDSAQLNSNKKAVQPETAHATPSPEQLSVVNQASDAQPPVPQASGSNEEAADASQQPLVEAVAELSLPIEPLPISMPALLTEVATAAIDVSPKDTQAPSLALQPRLATHDLVPAGQQSTPNHHAQQGHVPPQLPAEASPPVIPREPSAGDKRKRTPSMENMRDQAAKRSICTFVKYTGLARASGNSTRTAHRQASSLPAFPASLAHSTPVLSASPATMPPLSEIQANISAGHVPGHDLTAAHTSHAPAAFDHDPTVHSADTTPQPHQVIEHANPAGTPSDFRMVQPESDLAKVPAIPGPPVSVASPMQNGPLSGGQSALDSTNPSTPLSASPLATTEAQDPPILGSVPTQPRSEPAAHVPDMTARPFGSALLAPEDAESRMHVQAAAAPDDQSLRQSTTGDLSKHPTSSVGSQAGSTLSQTSSALLHVTAPPRPSPIARTSSEAGPSARAVPVASIQQQPAQLQDSPKTSPDIPLLSLCSPTGTSKPLTHPVSAAARQLPDTSDAPTSSGSASIGYKNSERDASRETATVISAQDSAIPSMPSTEGFRPATASASYDPAADPRRRAHSTSRPGKLPGASASAQPSSSVETATIRHALPAKPTVSVGHIAAIEAVSSGSSYISAPLSPLGPTVTKPEQGESLSEPPEELPDSSFSGGSASNVRVECDLDPIQSHLEACPGPHRLGDSSNASTAIVSQMSPAHPRDGACGILDSTSQPSPESWTTLQVRSNEASPDCKVVRALPPSDDRLQAESREPSADNEHWRRREGRSSSKDLRQSPQERVPHPDEAASNSLRSRDRAGESIQPKARVRDERPSRIDYLDSLRSQSRFKGDRAWFYFFAHMGRSKSASPILITQDWHVTESLISERAARVLIGEGNASIVRSSSGSDWLKLDLSWRYDSAKGSGSEWFRGQGCRFLIVPERYLSEGMYLGKEELDHFKLEIVPKSPHTRAFLGVRGSITKGTKLSAFPRAMLERHPDRPFQKICLLADFAIDHTRNIRSQRWAGRSAGVGTDTWRGHSTHSDTSRDAEWSSPPNRTEAERLRRNYTKDERASEAPKAAGLDRASPETDRRREAEKDLKHSSVSYTEPYKRRDARIRDEEVGQNEGDKIATSSLDAVLDTGSPLTEVSQAPDEEVDELMDDSDSDPRSAPETLEDLSEEERRIVMRRTAWLMQGHSAKTSSILANEPVKGLSLMGSSKRTKDLFQPSG